MEQNIGEIIVVIGNLYNMLIMGNMISSLKRQIDRSSQKMKSIITRSTAAIRRATELFKENQ